MLCLFVLWAGAVFSTRAQIDEEEEKSALDDTTTAAAKMTAENAAAAAGMLPSIFVIDTVQHMIWLGSLGVASHEVYEQIATIEFGMNIYPANAPEFQFQYKLANVGTMVALAFPVRFSGVRVHYKAKALFHDAGVSERSDSLSHFYFYAVNELVLGKTFTVKSLPFNLVPQFGMGIGHGIVLENRKNTGLKGTLTEHYAFHFNLGFQAQRYIKVDKLNFIFGAQFMWERAFNANEDTENRINFCIIVAD